MSEKQENTNRSFDAKSLEAGAEPNAAPLEFRPSGTAKVSEVEEDPSKFYVQRFGRLGGVLEKLFASGVEARGIERVPEDQRDTKRMWNK